MAGGLFTVSAPAESFLKIQGSRFHGFVQPARSLPEAEATLKEYQIRYADATHVCYAFRVGLLGDQFRYSDAGEPKNTAGLPIYNALRSASLSNVVCMVVRYYGGTKLGTGGLIEAYRAAAVEAIAQAALEQIVDRVMVEFSCAYPALPDLYSFLKRGGFATSGQTLEERAAILVWMERERLSELDEADLAYKNIFFRQVQ